MLEASDLVIVLALVRAYVSAGRIVLQGSRPELERLLTKALVHVDALEEYGVALARLLGDHWHVLAFALGDYRLPSERFLTGGLSGLTDEEFGLLLFAIGEQRKAHEVLAQAAELGELRHLAKIDCPFATSVGWCSSTRRGTSLA